MTPKIFNNVNNCTHSDKLFSELNIDHVFSDNAKSFLMKPCSKKEISLRQELFSTVLNSGRIDKIKSILSSLKNLERTLDLIKLSKTDIENIHYRIERISVYKTVVELLSDISDCGELLSRISKYFSAQTETAMKMGEAVRVCRNSMSMFTSGLLSFSEKIWLTPEDRVTDDYDETVHLAKQIGLDTPKKKEYCLRIDMSLSDALCKMYLYKVCEIKSIISQFDSVNFEEPLELTEELEFICEMYELFSRINKGNVKICFPQISDEPRYVAEDIIDITLAVKGCDTIVPNDAEFTEDVSFSFLMGANSGGKTTYLRAMAANLILFLAGCPILAAKAEIFPFDIVLSHFTSDERFTDAGRLDDEKERVVEMLCKAEGKKAFMFFNETYSGTDDMKGFELLKSAVDEIYNRKSFGIWVTHFHGVLTLNYPALTVQVSDDNVRMYRVIRSKNARSSYAADILEKYGLDKKSLKARLKKYEDKPFESECR